MLGLIRDENANQSVSIRIEVMGPYHSNARCEWSVHLKSIVTDIRLLHMLPFRTIDPKCRPIRGAAEIITACATYLLRF